MDEKQKRQKYYLYGLVPALIVWGLISVASDPVFGVFFMLGYSWPFMYYTPGFEEKALSRSYRFSFLGNLFRFQQYLFQLLPENPPLWMKPFARLIVPFLITGVLSIINPTWSPLFTIMGWASFELFCFLNEKKGWGFI